MKRLKLLLASIVLVLVSGCGVNGNCSTCSGGTGGGGGSGSGKLSLEEVNKYITGSDWFDMRSYGNKVTLIPFTHINGPKAEWDFFAIVNFEYDATTYFKYQLTYLSCTCRSADVNYWQTMYVELTVPASSELKDVEIQKISFEMDGEEHYNAGFWGDSGITSAINDLIGYKDIRDAFIPFLIGKNYEYMSSLSVTEDINAEQFKTEMAGYTVKGFNDDINKPSELIYFGGASVSTNNLIRSLTALMKYHGENNI